MDTVFVFEEDDERDTASLFLPRDEKEVERVMPPLFTHRDEQEAKRVLSPLFTPRDEQEAKRFFPPMSSPRDLVSPELSADKCIRCRAHSDELVKAEIVNPKSGSITIVYEGRWK